jgi:uncharacterized protein DUF4268
VIKLGEIKRLKTRDVWADEARDFTPWLAANLPLLGKSLDMDLELTSQETPVGDFCCDLLARDLGRDRIVIIENQFGPTDHDHLGKILTYAAGLDAEAVIWIAEKIREEHRETLEWLNRHTDKDIRFFAVTVELIQIDSSPPAANFKAVVFPNEWQRETKVSVEGSSPRSEAYRAWFQQLIDELREKHRYTNARAAQLQNWYAFSSGIAGITYNASFAHGGRVRTEIYIDMEDAEANKKVFDGLYKQRESLEQEFGEPLSWERLDQRRASRVAVYRPGSIESGPEDLSRIREWAIDRLLKFRSLFTQKMRALVDSSET